MCSIFHCIDKRSQKRKNELLEATVSFSFSVELKNIAVRVVHAGGREEFYPNAIPASQLMQKYPGMYIASPDIFKRPHKSIISADDNLVPGKKYYLIPSTTVWKLKRKHSQKKKVKVARADESISDSKDVPDTSDDFSEDSVCSARDFYISRDDQSVPRVRQPTKEKKPFVPPIEKARTWKGCEWEPSLTSIEEISP